MNATKTYLIECSRGSSITAQQTTTTTTKSSNNARWTNLAPVNLQVGDTVNLEYSVIHSIGESEDSTIELTGENDLSSGLRDNIVGLKFINYICDNGYNTVKLPYVAPITFLQNNKLTYTPQYKITSTSTPTAHGWAVNDTFELVKDNTKTGKITTLRYQSLPDYVYPLQFEMTSDDWSEYFNEQNQSVQIVRTTLPEIDGQQPTLYITGLSPNSDDPARPPTNPLTLVNFRVLGMTICQDVATIPNTSASMDFNYGMPIPDDGYNFQFSFHEDDSHPQIVAPNNIHSSYAIPFHENNLSLKICVKGEKFIKLQTGYKGPYRSNNDVAEDTATFYSGEDDLYPLYSETIISIDAPIYESPTTITNKMNIKLHETYSQNEQPPEGSQSYLPIDENGNVMPHVSGNLLKVIPCNGINETLGGNYWGELAVRDLNKWIGIQAMMRCELAFNGMMQLTTNGMDYFFPRPCIMIDGGECVNTIKYNNNASTDTLECPFYPRISTEFSFEASNNDTTTIYCGYSTIPKYFLITTNIKYTANNIARIGKWFKNNEIYDGISTNRDDADSDIENWRVMADLGSSRDGINTTNTRTTDATYMPRASDYKFLAHGKPYINGINGYTPVSNFAFSLPNDPYDMSNLLTHFGGNLSTPRSDYCMKGNTLWMGETLTPQQITINTITTDVPHRFKDNVNKDTSMALFSRMLPDYEKKIRISNLSDGQEQPVDEGDGQMSIDPRYDGVDVSLSGDLGVYGVEITNQYSGVYIFNDMTPNGEPTYWRGFYRVNGQAGEQEIHQHIYRIEEGADADHIDHGGYSMRLYNNGNPNGDMPLLNDVYIYSARNSVIKAGQNVNNKTFNNNTLTVDFKDITQILFYVSDDYMWLGIMREDINNYFKIQLYPRDGMPDDGAEHLPFIRNYENFGTLNYINYLYVQTSNGTSTAPLMQIDLSTVTGGHYSLNNQNPIETRENTEKVCAFLLYADSATKQNGQWTVSTDFALPSVHQGMFFGCSPSFMDNPAVWCVNGMSTTNDILNETKNSQNYISIGANDPTIEFDSTLSRTVLKQLHTQRQLGINEMPTDGDGNFITSTLGEEVIKFSDASFPYQKFDNVSNDPTFTYYTYAPALNGGFSTSVSGLFIDSIYGQSDADAFSSTSDMVELATDELFYNSLLYKLGFVRTDLYADFGLSWNMHTPSLIGDYSKANRYKQVRPLTTNAQLIISAQPDFAVMDSSNKNKNGEGFPTYQLGFSGISEFSLDGSISTQLVASSLPTKLSNPFYQIYSDIIPSDYISDGQTLSCIGIVPKNYISNDYIYGFQTSFAQPVLFPIKLSNITTEIRLPNGRLAPIDPNSTVIYKIQRPFFIGLDEQTKKKSSNGQAESS